MGKASLTLHGVANPKLTISVSNQVMHLASPYSYAVKDNEKELLIPAICGTQSILESVRGHGDDVEHVVITSSFSAIFDVSKGLNPGYVYTEKDWNPITYEAARDGDAGAGYFGSKVLAEKAAWAFATDEDGDKTAASGDCGRPTTKFNITVLCPPVIYGPAAHDLGDLSSLGTSLADIQRFVTGELLADDLAPGPMPYCPFVDVRDVAAAHVRCLEGLNHHGPGVANQRILIASEMFSYQLICDVLHASDRVPAEVKANIPVGEPGKNVPGPHVFTFDASKSEKLLGMKYRPLQESIADMVLNLVEAGKT
jgi:nucleoside-diphosphate-sugar epimerase